MSCDPRFFCSERMAPCLLPLPIPLGVLLILQRTFGGGMRKTGGSPNVLAGVLVMASVTGGGMGVRREQTAPGTTILVGCYRCAPPDMRCTHTPCTPGATPPQVARQDPERVLHPCGLCAMPSQEVSHTHACHVPQGCQPRPRLFSTPSSRAWSFATE